MGAKEFHLGAGIRLLTSRKLVEAAQAQQKPDWGQLLTFNVESGEHTQRARLKAEPCPVLLRQRPPKACNLLGTL